MKNIFLILLIIVSKLLSQFGSQDSGGKLIPEQKCYDVKFYDLNLEIDPYKKAITGYVIINAKAENNFSKIVVDLDTTFSISEILLLEKAKQSELKFSHTKGKIWIDFPYQIKKDEMFSIKINYAGVPRIAKRPPWDDGFIWAKTKENKNWITLTCQGGGADIWFPCKDHPSDEPDSASINFTVPSDLVCVSSGKLISKVNNNNGTTTWHWFSSTPINNYNIMLYLGPYIPIEYDYTSITGEKIPFTVWVLPESFEKAKEHSKQFLLHMKINEELVGPYPFRIDKYSVVETPHLGMEHQTAIAYGAGWKNHKDFPFDWLHHHEFSHEWWGNLVTCKDWSDFWIHEGTGTYMQPLYLEKVFGKEMYMGYLKSIRKFSNKQPVAPRGEKTSGEVYNLDIYYKGAWILHTLRNYLGDETFFKIFRRWAYPTKEMEKIKTGAQCRNATTDEFLEIAENISHKKLDWFWEVYFRTSSLPKLHYKKVNNENIFWWETENNLSFDLPIEIKADNKIFTIEMQNNKAMFNFAGEIEIDPEEKILKELIKE
ncbi:M1 family metallopeptidase [Stygiobacter electus]|uniref:Aminopeptidase N n=1 Tax=Stygiobacter electus TaxID=3032292 RepID=A0AAE3P2H4_9BACT|nr:M1 family metallopeptidase [Stygiobacter electus]MDF1613025.1 M1 family metallopeptidase [Stygiobacter electus]